MGAWNGRGNSHDEDDDDWFTDAWFTHNPYPLLPLHVDNAFLDETALGKYADLSRDDVHDDDVLWGDRGYFAPPDELDEERSPLDETMWSSGPGPWDPGFGLPVRLRLGHGDVHVSENVPEPAGVPMDVFGPGLSKYTWLWRTAEAELKSFADEPRRIGDTMPLVVAQVAEEMLAAGPNSLPGLVEAAVAFRIGDADEVRRYVASELEARLEEGGEPVEEPAQEPDDDGDPVAKLLARAMVRADFDSVEPDVHALAADLLFRNGEAPVELAERIAGILPTLGDIPAESVGPALEAAAELVRDGLVPVGRRDEGRAVASAAGWLAIGAGRGCPPGAIAMLLCLPSAPRTLMRAQARGFGPFGRYLGGCGDEVVASWREGGTILLAKPGLGKTQLMLWLSACAPGAVVAATPNVLDVYEFAARATDHDVLVYDPGGLMGSDVPPGIKLVRLDLYSQVHDYHSAGVVASQIVEVAGNHAGGRHEQFWLSTSAAMLQIHLFAGKCAERSIADVKAWLDRDEEDEIIGILARSKVEAACDAFTAHLRKDPGLNPRQSITASAQADFRAFANLSTEGEPLDFDRFVAGKGTLVLLGDPTTAAACKAAVAYTTRQLIEARFRLQRRGGAGAPMACFVDEAAYSPGLSPILAQVLALGPNRGLNPVAACQTLEQFEGVPGGAREITRAAARTVIFPDSMPPEVRQMASFDDADIDPPEDGATYVLEGNRLRRMRPYAAHEMGLWRLCHLEAAYSRAGAAPIAYW